MLIQKNTTFFHDKVNYKFWSSFPVTVFARKWQNFANSSILRFHKIGFWASIFRLAGKRASAKTHKCPPLHLYKMFLILFGGKVGVAGDYPSCITTIIFLVVYTGPWGSVGLSTIFIIIIIIIIIGFAPPLTLAQLHLLLQSYKYCTVYTPSVLSTQIHTFYSTVIPIFSIFYLHWFVFIYCTVQNFFLLCFLFV